MDLGRGSVPKKVPCLVLVHILIHYVFWMTYRIRWKNIFVPIMKVSILHLNIITE